MYHVRLKIFLILILLAMGLVSVRLAGLQLLGFRSAREQQQASILRLSLVHGLRGRIVDFKGRPLARDRASFDVCIDYRALQQDPQWMARQARRYLRDHKDEFNAFSPDQRLARARQVMTEKCTDLLPMLAGLSGHPLEELEAQWRRISRRVHNIKRGISKFPRILEQNIPHPILRDVDDSLQVRIRAFVEHWPGLSVQSGTAREYTYPEAASHLIGAMGYLTDADIDQLTAEGRYFQDKRHAETEALVRGYLPTDRIGRRGIERICESRLRASRGYLITDKLGNLVEEVPARKGDDVRLTVDIELQAAIGVILGDPISGIDGEPVRPPIESAAVAVIDVATGQLRAAVSHPGFSLVATAEQYNAYRQDPLRPLINRAVSGRYPPGSIVKPMVLIAGLSTGMITADTVFSCELDQRRPRCMRVVERRMGHGPLSADEALMRSCNFYFVSLGIALSGPSLVHWYDLFGAGEGNAFGMTSLTCTEQAQWQQVRPRQMDYPRIRSRHAASYFAVGQLTRQVITPIQAANVAATLARGGVYKGVVLMSDPPAIAPSYDLDIAPDAFRAVQAAMVAVVQDARGTGKRAAITGLAIAGKTGTADTGVKTPPHAWFICYAPVRQPQVAVAVVVEHGGHGGEVAAPIARRVMQACIDQGYLDDPLALGRRVRLAARSDVNHLGAKN